MAHFSQLSTLKLEGCEPSLQELFHRVIKNYDCTILEGHRNEIRQNTLFERGRSKLMWPRSRHNYNPSRAVDCAPWPIQWSNMTRFYHFGGYVLGMAHSLKIPLRWGGDWDRDLDFSDQTFNDLIHFELV